MVPIGDSSLGVYEVNSVSQAVQNLPVKALGGVAAHTRQKERLSDVLDKAGALLTAPTFYRLK